MDTASTASTHSKAKKGKKRVDTQERKEERKKQKDLDNFLKIAEENRPLTCETLASLHSLDAQVKSLGHDLLANTIVLQEVVSALKHIPTTTTSIPPLPHYTTKIPPPPTSCSEKRRRAIAGNNNACCPIKDRDTVEEYDSGDDDYDNFIEDDQFHPTWGYLVHCITGEFIGHHCINEVTSFIKSELIFMARSGKLEKNFTTLPVDTRTVLANVFEKNFYNFVAECEGHCKALQAIQEVSGQVGLSNLMIKYPAHPIPPTPSPIAPTLSATPSGVSTPVAGSSSNPILVGNDSLKLAAAFPAPPKVKPEPSSLSLPAPPKVKAEPSSSSLPSAPVALMAYASKRPSEDVQVAPMVKRRKSALFNNPLSMPTPAFHPKSAIAAASGLQRMGPPALTSSARPIRAGAPPLYTTPANPQALYATPLSSPSATTPAYNEPPIAAPVFNRQIVEVEDDDAGANELMNEPNIEPKQEDVEEAGMDLDNADQQQLWNTVKTHHAAPPVPPVIARGAPHGAVPLFPVVIRKKHFDLGKLWQPSGKSHCH
ncbi:hypothetical protein NMY22_g2770 [Coprinellus aureogranulatus]|nr:hypothetical protein NMY22_g2770 [Coprinellus aureogranulatus]